MPALKLKFNTAQLKKALRECPEAITRAEVRALNRTGVTMRAVGAREMKANIGNVKIAAVKDLLHVRNATMQRRTVSVEVTGARMPLIAFNAKGPEPSRGRGRGVTASLKGGQGLYPNAFIARMKSGHRGVFKRLGRLRLPIVELFGPSMPQVFRTVSPVVRAAGVTALWKNLGSELNFELRRLGKMASLKLGGKLAA
jgi:hypothetical protein